VLSRYTSLFVTGEPDRQPAPYALRAALPAEQELLYAIHRESMGPYVEATWGDWDEAIQREFFEARMARGLLNVILVDGEVGGILELDDRFDCVFVSNIQLAARCRRRGIGSRIIADVQRDAAARGQAVELTVLRVNPARKVYERLGFVQTELTNTHHYMRWQAGGAGASGVE
jgi:GNAT superfamily N-acetyltransferase